MKKALLVATVSGFLPQFEKDDAMILREMGYQIHYAANFNHPVYEFDEEELVHDGIVLHHIDIEKSPGRICCNTRAFRQLKQIIENEQIDLVHCHTPMGGVLARIAATASSRKPYIIYTAHGFHFYQGAPVKNWLFFYPVERYLAHHTNQIITINKEDLERAGTFRLRKGGSVTQIHGVGVDMDRFCPRPWLRAEKRKELHIPEQAFLIVTAAELNENKNQKIIIKAIAALGKTDIYYLICGNGPNENRLKKLIAELGMEQQIHIMGFRSDMENILAAADCFAFPSYREGLGIAAVEALCCGIPLIAADNRGTREYAVDGCNSIVTDADNLEGFQAAIRRLYTDREYRMFLAGNCRASVEKFGKTQTAEMMHKIYRVADCEISES